MLQGSRRHPVPFQKRSALMAMVILVSLLMASPAAVKAGSGFRIAALPTAVAAGYSRSKGFALHSCIDPVMAGVGTSLRYRVVSGCGALQETVHFSAGVPANGTFALILLALALVSSAGFYLRPGGSHAS